MNFIKKHSLFFLLFLGLLVRLSIIFYDYSWDVNNHMVWAKDFLARGTVGFYETISSNVFANLTPNYPPLAIYIFVLMRLINPIIHDIYWWLNLNISFMPSNLIFFLEKTVFLASLMKIPAILADLGLAYLVYLFAKKLMPKNKKGQLLTTCFVLFNPALIFNSALWGQIDSIPIFLFLIAVYFLMYKNHSIISVVLTTLAILVKPTVLIFFPVYIYVFMKNFGIKKSLLGFIIAISIFIFSFKPFVIHQNIIIYSVKTYVYKILAAQSLPYATNGAFNFWTLFSQTKSIVDTPYRLYGYVVVGVINIIIIWLLSKTNNLKQDLFMGLFLTSFGAFLFLTKMHERYSLLPLIFLLIYSIKNTKFYHWYFLLSIISFINHYRNWAVPRIEFILKIIESPQFAYIIASVNLVIFFYLSRSFFLSIFSSPKPLTIK